MAFCAFLTRNVLENDLACLAICNLSRIHNARTILRADHDAIEQHEDSRGKIKVEERLRCRELEDLPVLVKPIEAFAPQFDQPRLHRLIQCFGCSGSGLCVRLFS